jgi:hypothetical protein
LNSALFGPRQQGTQAAGGTAAGGSGLVGVASKYKGETVKVYRERSKFQHWEFIYDPAKDKSGQAAGQQQGQAGANGQQNPLGQGQQGQQNSGQGSRGGFGQQDAPAVPGTALPVPGGGAGRPGGIGGGGFGSTPATGGGGGFIGGPAPSTLPNTVIPSPNGNNQTRPGQPTTPVQPPRQGGGGFIGGK